MKPALKLTALAALVLIAQRCPAQETKPAASNVAASPAAQSQTQKTIEAYLRNLYAFGPEVKLAVGPLKETPVEGLLETNVDVTIGENKENATFYVSKDGQYLFRGELSNLTKDPLAENRARIQMTDAPSTGDANAPVTLVEYADFECPVCRNLHDVLRGLLPNYAGKIRLVFKDFPIEQLHPWARTAAIAGRCAYRQQPPSFWKMFDLIYDNQDIISASNAWTKMTEYAGQARLDVDAFKSCMASPEAAAAVNASHANGELLEVSSTPTVFVNGRRLVGADPHLLEQYINYELARHGAGKPAEKK
ncbi:MAG TPA: thioredoxin domain-containing protein [Candidatus Acidoferrum sp.]|nr:thioredoxin domain-containing protein [Candidatus Acidoferrum sp.]